MVSNYNVLEAIGSLLSDMGYDIKYNDLDMSDSNTIILFLKKSDNRDIKSLSGDIINRLSLVVRVQGDNKVGSQVKCEDDLIEIMDRLTLYNTEINGVKILGCYPESKGTLVGKNFNNVPIYVINFNITFY